MEIERKDEQALEDELHEMITRGRREVESFVRETPHAALGLAAACGFILGGGLTPRRLFRLGVMIGGPIVSKQMLGQTAEWISRAIPQQTNGSASSS